MKINIKLATILLVSSLVTSSIGTVLAQNTTFTTINKTTDKSIRPFKVHISESKIVDLKQRILNTKWPDRELVQDQTQGVKLSTMKSLADYWATQYDWHKIEAKLNSYPQYLTKIQGLDIHFIHVRSKNKNALPIIITHGWPGSIIEQLKIIEPLTNPEKYGGSAEDAFDVIIPSLPGHGFSETPKTLGWNPVKIAKAWIELMDRLNYDKYVAQGGDWGNAITENMALLAPEELLGIHTNMAAAVPLEITAALAKGTIPDGLTEDQL